MTASSIGEQMLAAINAKFVANVTTATTFRSRASALALPEGLAIILEPEIEPVKYIANMAAHREFMVRITILARAAPPGAPDTVADSVRVPMHATLMSDPTLGGLALRIIEDSSEWEFEEADQTAVKLVCKYKLAYMTPTQDLTTAA